MKRCPQCGREYDTSMMFCLDDGAELLYGPASADEPATAILSESRPVGIVGGLTSTTDQSELRTAFLQPPATAGSSDAVGKRFDKRLLGIPVLLAVIVLGGFLTYRYIVAAGAGEINSIAVLPFENRSGTADTD